MFNYQFMITAFIVGMLLSVVIPLIGSQVVFKRLSMTGDALSHTAIAGVAIGLILGYNPVLVAIIGSVIAALLMEVMRKKFYKYSELSIALVLSLGIGLAGLLSTIAPMANFSTYLFGSIFAITDFELNFTIGIFVFTILMFTLFYKELMYTAYNEENAKIAGVPTRILNILFTVLTAVIVATASKIIGALIVSSLMVVPVAFALQVAKSYKTTILFAVFNSVVSTALGITVSFYLDLGPGGTIVIISIILLLIAVMLKALHNALNKNSIK